jgi:predicted ATPase
MTLHKLQTDRDGSAVPVNVSLTTELYDITSAVVRARAVRACDLGTRSLPIYRLLRWSVHRKVIDLFDDLALDSMFSPQRLDADTALLAAPGVFVSASGRDKGDYCSCVFQLWADSRERADEVAARLQAVSGELRMQKQTFVLDWTFATANGELRNTSFEEVVSDRLLDEAYPALGMGIDGFVRAYLAAPEAVLILLGPPGGGKTRLVREILAALSRRKGENAEVLYTTDKRALASDEMFVGFLTGTHDAFVIEDTDHLLKARTSGNEDMHRFLGIADGIARAQKRKIIFTTNLPNITDIDPALIRPGRCYAVKYLRALESVEAARLAEKICESDPARTERAIETLRALNARSYSVAQVYRACE